MKPPHCMRYEKNDRSVTVGAVIPCAGKGARSGLSDNKVLHTVGCKCSLEYVLDAFTAAGVDHIAVVAAENDLSAVKDIAARYPSAFPVIGGATRGQSVLNGLRARKCDIAVIHDGARPFVSPDLILRAVKSAIEFGSGIAAVPSVDTVKRVDGDGRVSSLPRGELFNAQTPQAFSYPDILFAYERFSGEQTDDAEVYAQAGFSPRLVDGSYDNIKITSPRDLLALPTDCRIGVGYDVHRLVEGRKLVLGGVHIPFEKGLLGHSDADALLHAVTDALLSAANLPDIGVLYPDSDERFSGISSALLLSDALKRATGAGFSVRSVSAVVMAQKPKLSPYIPAIRKSIADLLGIPTERANVSATTTEGLGVIGQGDAIAASASVILTESAQ